MTWHGWKYIYGYQPNLDATFEMLFDLNKDPGERVNRLADTSGEAVEMLAVLRQRLEEHRKHCVEQIAAAGQSEGAAIPDETRENLLKMGYTGENK